MVVIIIINFSNYSWTKHHRRVIVTINTIAITITLHSNQTPPMEQRHINSLVLSFFFLLSVCVTCFSFNGQKQTQALNFFLWQWLQIIAYLVTRQLSTTTCDLRKLSQFPTNNIHIIFLRGKNKNTEHEIAKSSSRIVSPWKDPKWALKSRCPLA